MKTAPQIYERGKEEYILNERVKTFQVAACYTESQGYKKWNRVRELIEFSKFMGFKKIGIAHCIGLVFEASLLALVLEQEGFEVTQILCKTGAIHKEDIGVPHPFRLRPEETFEAACNPVVQAEICNAANTDLNVMVGLCLGHDILFTMYSKAPVTTLIVKDRTNGHNPAAALYSFYQRGDLIRGAGVYPPTRPRS
jgi:uncharacterized metal-binding protein